MTFDLGVFSTIKPHTDTEAVKRYVAYCEQEDLSPYIESSPYVAALLAELTEQYPQIDDVSDEELESCQWSVVFEISEGHILIAMVSSAAEIMCPVIIALAENMVLFVWTLNLSQLLRRLPVSRLKA